LSEKDVLRTVAVIALAVFLILYGLMAVTNVAVAYMGAICGFAALVAGILWLILGVRQTTA
jgi:uncharacterized membrane protein HdeD (DUF308 family)